MLCGLSTADMVAFTGRTLVSLYPKLTAQQLALPTGRLHDSSTEVCSNNRSELDSIGVTLLQSNEQWARHCGDECPSLIRSISEDLGIFHLTDRAVDRVLDQWDVSEGQWSLGWDCANSLCDQYGN